MVPGEGTLWAQPVLGHAAQRGIVHASPEFDTTEPSHGRAIQGRQIQREADSGARQRLQGPGAQVLVRRLSQAQAHPQYEGGSAGNLSFRWRDGEDRFVITSSGITSKGELKDDDLALVEACDPKSGTVSACGTRPPSSESMMHWMIYKARQDVGAIFHGHCGDILTHADSLKMLETKSEEQYGTPDLARSVVEVLGAEDFIILKGHGFISLGRTMAEAGQRALTVYGRSLTLRDVKKR